MKAIQKNDSKESRRITHECFYFSRNSNIIIGATCINRPFNVGNNFKVVLRRYKYGTRINSTYFCSSNQHRISHTG